MLTVCSWIWGGKYTPDYVVKLAAGVRRNLQEPHRFILISGGDDNGPTECSAFGNLVDDIYGIMDPDLLKVPGCFARLRMFDPDWQKCIGVDDRLVCLDLDMVITGSLDPLFYRAEPFMILLGANASNPCPYNGSVMMLRRGAHPEVWSDFSLKKAAKIPFHSYPDDQGWLHHKIPKASGWKVGAQSGIFGFKKPGWPDKSLDLPPGARIVSFFGSRDPSQYTSLDWVKANWI